MIVVTEGEALGTALSAGLAGTGFDVDAADAREPIEALLADRPADIAFLTVPWRRIDDLAAGLRDAVRSHVLVVCVSALTEDADGFFMEHVPEGSVARRVARLFPDPRIVGAFQQFRGCHLELASVGALRSDVPVLGDDREATDLVEEVVDSLRGLEAVYFGGLDAAPATEGLVAIINEVARQGSPAGFRLVEGGGLRILD